MRARPEGEERERREKGEGWVGEGAGEVREEHGGQGRIGGAERRQEGEIDCGERRTPGGPLAASGRTWCGL